MRPTTLQRKTFLEIAICLEMRHTNLEDTFTGSYTTPPLFPSPTNKHQIRQTKFIWALVGSVSGEGNNGECGLGSHRSAVSAMLALPRVTWHSQMGVLRKMLSCARGSVEAHVNLVENKVS